MKRFLPMPLSVLLLLVTLAAPPSARAAEPAAVSFRAVCFDPRETETPVWFVAHGGSRKTLDLDKSRLSENQKADVREGGFVDFFASKEPTKGELPAVTVTLPAGFREHLLFVIIPARTGYLARAIQLSPAVFKPGATLLINSAPVDVAAKLGSSGPVTVPSGSSRILPIPKGCKESMLPVQIFDRVDKAGPWRITQSTRWAVDLRFRSYLFFHHSQESDQLMLHGVTERVDSPEKKN
jgi:hypothetical protein